MTRPRFEAVTIDCRDKHALAAFWCELLGTTVRGEFGQYLGLHATTEGHPRLVFQQVDEPAAGRSRVHLDLDSEDVAADTARAVVLGASVVQEVTDFGVSWSVLSDPEGNLFCIVPVG
ncbi:MAG: glyoxalase/bleomycin resistance protein/dioxygenase [Frankiales bacterium]|jgi:predicted enzyme related to lactoylglutathione lyase|nr:glyoxalase/bleomycin resistance protein/dioxygenase [Frankiales bacterium]